MVDLLPAVTTLRLLTSPDLPAFVALRNASLLRYPDAFTSDYATEKDRPPQAFASRLGDAQIGHFILGAFDAQGLPPRAIRVQGQFFDKLHMRLNLAALRDNQPS